VSAAFVLPPGMPILVRQVLLNVIGVAGITVAERRLFGGGWRRIVDALGFVAPGPGAVVVAVVVSLPMWLFLPIFGRLVGAPSSLSPDWLPILLGVILRVRPRRLSCTVFCGGPSSARRRGPWSTPNSRSNARTPTGIACRVPGVGGPATRSTRQCSSPRRRWPRVSGEARHPIAPRGRRRCLRVAEW
jgi:hypothetical protein